MATLIYIYGIVPAESSAPPVELVGLEGARVELLPMGAVAALVSELPDEDYSDEALDARLDDLAWVGERGLAHERVLDWYAERGPVIPLSLFSLHRDRARAEQRIGSDEEELARTLTRLSGRKEWGIKLWRRENEVREGIDGLSPSLQELAAQMEAAPAGKRFLLEKRRQAMRAEEVRLVSNRIAHDIYGALLGPADAGATVPIPAGAAGGDRVLLLHAAYLVPDLKFGAFQAAVTEQAARIAGSGFEIEFTGPWPPYHFSEPDNE